MQPKKFFEKYTTVRGEELEIYPVPQQLVRGIVPSKKKPERPSIDMQLPKGQVQKRWIKADDPGWEQYQAELEDWEQEKNDLQEAVSYCLALKTYPFPEPLRFSKEVEDLALLELLLIPSNPYLKKFMWLRENVLAQHDEYNIRWIISKLSGVPEEVIEEQKSSFRNFLLGKTIGGVGEAASGESETPEETEE